MSFIYPKKHIYTFLLDLQVSILMEFWRDYLTEEMILLLLLQDQRYIFRDRAVMKTIMSPNSPPIYRVRPTPFNIIDP